MMRRFIINNYKYSNTKLCCISSRYHLNSLRIFNWKSFIWSSDFHFFLLNYDINSLFQLQLLLNLLSTLREYYDKRIGKLMYVWNCINTKQICLKTFINVCTFAKVNLSLIVKCNISFTAFRESQSLKLSVNNYCRRFMILIKPWKSAIFW